MSQHGSAKDDGHGASHHASAKHVVICFEALHAHHQHSAAPRFDLSDTVCPLFVTWSKLITDNRHIGQYSLRGCIGTLTARPLRTALPEYALTAALRDSRFPPITQNEVQALKCTVSLLHGLETAANWRDWQVGVHGLIISFKDPDTAETRTGTFLPEIAEAEGWDAKATVDALISKAGYRGRPTPAIREALQVIRYQSTTHSMTHAEYLTAAEGRSKSSAQQTADQLPQQGRSLVGVVPA